MSDRSLLASGATVGVAIAGSAAGSLLISLAGPVLGLLIHIWTQYTSQRAKRDSDGLIEHQRVRIFQLEMELAAAKGVVVSPPKAD
jgi:hypothetical protein